MRKILLSILLASVAASPALAEPRHHDDDSGRPQAHEQHQSHDEGRRGNGGDNGQRQHVEMRQQVQVQQQNAYRGGGGWDRGRADGNRVQEQVRVQQQQAYDRRGDYQNYRHDRSNWNGGQAVQVQQYDRSGSWARDRGSWSQNRDGDYRQRGSNQTYYRDRNRLAGSGTWDRNWRNDHRYDWRRYRDHHRSTFHLGIYFDPFGYGYRPFDVGYRLAPAYFGNQYWIDPALYGLPYPPPGAQWVRYWNDAVLVDMYSGQVIDVIRDFFW
jgi:Ni/Co efflux regulator RcnB